MKIHIFIRNLKIIKINFTEKILLNLHKTKNLIMNNIIFHLNLKNNDIFISGSVVKKQLETRFKGLRIQFQIFCQIRIQ